MSDTNESTTVSSVVPTDDGKMNVMGVEIKISDIIGDKIVTQWMSQLSEDDMKTIFDALHNEIFERNEFKKQREVDKSSSYWGNHYEDTPMWKIAKRYISKRLGDVIEQKCNEIINSEEYQKKADTLAQEIVDYATEGYKTDMMKRVKERLVGNLLDASPKYNGSELRSIINQEISNRMGMN